MSNMQKDPHESPLDSHPVSHILYYVHDPMCSWCYAFKPVWQQVLEQLPSRVEVRYLLGGLAPDSDNPMPQSMQQSLAGTWQHITQAVPGTVFNFDFWQDCEPRRSTYPSCRAVLLAGQAEGFCKDASLSSLQRQQAMITAIQAAYYQQAKNPSDADTLIACADKIGLDTDWFAQALNSQATRQALLDEIAQARAIGGDSFPSLFLQAQQQTDMKSAIDDVPDANRVQPIALNYTQVEAVLLAIQKRML